MTRRGAQLLRRKEYDMTNLRALVSTAQQREERLQSTIAELKAKVESPLSAAAAPSVDVVGSPGGARSNREVGHGAR